MSHQPFTSLKDAWETGRDIHSQSFQFASYPAQMYVRDTDNGRLLAERVSDLKALLTAINQGKIDVMNIFTTDGQLSASDIVVLEDDKGLYPSYMCGFVVRQEVLDQHPELQGVFDRVTGILSDAEMAEMNYQVETEGLVPEEAASGFLRTKGLLHE